MSPKKKSPSKRVKKHRWVIKVGSNLVCNGGPLLLRHWMQQVARLKRDHSAEIIWVTSGAIASAIDRTQFKNANRTLSEKQALSAIGQPLLMDLYNLSLQSVGLVGAQILLTYDDMGNDKRRSNLMQTLEKLLEWNIVPILNENDAVATDEIKFGDNDSLSAKVACMMDATRLIILTDVDGYFDGHPQKNPKAKLVKKLSGVSDAVLESVKDQVHSERGTGGMFSKLCAGREASTYGIETWLLRGDIPSVLLQLIEEKAVGTQIEARRG